GVDTLHVAGSLTFKSFSTFLVDLGPRTAAHKVDVPHDLTLEAGAKVQANVVVPLAATSYALLTTPAGSPVPTTGFEALPPVSGGPVIVGGKIFNYSYGSGTAFELTPLGTTVALDAGDLTVTDTRGQDDALTVSRIG